MQSSVGGTSTLIILIVKVQADLFKIGYVALVQIVEYRRVQWSFENWGASAGKLRSVEELFAGRHFDREVIILCVRWYLRYKLSFRDLAEMMAFWQVRWPLLASG
jgi:hypothetical protein